jgi:hypothetical protein
MLFLANKSKLPLVLNSQFMITHKYKTTALRVYKKNKTKKIRTAVSVSGICVVRQRQQLSASALLNCLAVTKAPK